jgi:molybdate transport system permease protein
VVLPEARRGLLTAFTLAWARALGEFGPILIFAGATRLRTEVLSVSVYLEFSVGQLNGAVAVSLLMIITSVLVLVSMRIFGLQGVWRKVQ